MSRILTTIILILFSNTAFAGFNISVSKSYLKPRGWEYPNSADRFTIPTISYGYSYFVDSKYLLSISTNRYLNSYGGKKEIINNGILLDKNTKPTIDGLKLGYRYKRSIITADIYNVKLESNIYFNDSLIEKNTKKDIAFGNSYVFLITKKINTNISIIYPNKELDLDYGVSAGVGYSF